MKGRAPLVTFVMFLSLGVWAAAPLGHFTVQAAQGVVKDNRSGLTWERGHSSAVKSWGEASDYCAKLSLGGFASGWRLPTAFELETLVDVREAQPAVDTEAFPSTPVDLPFWTSTAVAADPTGSQWVLYFSHGALQDQVTSEASLWVRCVR